MLISFSVCVCVSHVQVGLFTVQFPVENFEVMKVKNKSSRVYFDRILDLCSLFL